MPRLKVAVTNRRSEEFPRASSNCPPAAYESARLLRAVTDCGSSRSGARASPLRRSILPSRNDSSRDCSARRPRRLIERRAPSRTRHARLRRLADAPEGTVPSVLWADGGLRRKIDRAMRVGQTPAPAAPSRARPGRALQRSAASVRIACRGLREMVDAPDPGRRAGDTPPPPPADWLPSERRSPHAAPLQRRDRSLRCVSPADIDGALAWNRSQLRQLRPLKGSATGFGERAGYLTVERERRLSGFHELRRSGARKGAAHPPARRKQADTHHRQSTSPGPHHCVRPTAFLLT